jgi:hypothetical protein
MAIDSMTDGTVICTEFQKPRDRPSQLRPVQASDQALTQGSKVISTGGAKMLPSRISGMPFSEVTIITYSGSSIIDRHQQQGAVEKMLRGEMARLGLAPLGPDVGGDGMWRVQA